MSNPLKDITKKDAPVKGSTQEHLPIKAIHDDVVILKDGSASVVLETTAVNFDLLSENEQLAIISSYAGLLNSLSFAIQIVIRSKRLDVSEYLKTISKIEEKQNNALLKGMMQKYRIFVETLTQENEVLDKQFFVVISVSYVEVGIINNIEKDLGKALTLLIPRRDHIIKQLARIGLKATQLNNEKLLKLFYDYYNQSFTQQDIRTFIDKSIPQNTAATQMTTPPKIEEVEQKKPIPKPVPQPTPEVASPPPPQPQVVPQVPAPAPNIMPTEIEIEQRQSHYHAAGSIPFSQPSPITEPTQNSGHRSSTPFVVEELTDDYSKV